MSAGVLLHKEIGGTGPTMVFLPGIGGTTRYWESRVAPLAEDHHLVLVDLLGFGRSPKPWIRYTVERHVAELQRSLEDRAPFTLVGHSFGAILALAYAVRHPEMVRRLILVSLPYFGSEERAVRFFRGKGTADGWVASNVILAAVACVVTRRLLRRVLPWVLRDLPREVVEDLVQYPEATTTRCSAPRPGCSRRCARMNSPRLPTHGRLRERLLAATFR